MKEAKEEEDSSEFEKLTSLRQTLEIISHSCPISFLTRAQRTSTLEKRVTVTSGDLDTVTWVLLME